MGYGRVADDFVKTLTRCLHCGDEIGINQKYCKNCGTAGDRRKMDEDNKKIFADAGLKKEECKQCNG